MLLVPVVLLTMIFVVQYGLAYHARRVLAGAANDGAAAAARHDSSTDAGIDITEALIDESAGNLLTSTSVSGSNDGQTVTITASGNVVTLLPFFGPITVRASGSAKVETFDPQGGP